MKNFPAKPNVSFVYNKPTKKKEKEKMRHLIKVFGYSFIRFKFALVFVYQDLYNIGTHKIYNI